MTGNQLADILQAHIPALRKLGDNPSADCSIKISINFDDSAIWIDDMGVTLLGKFGSRHLRPDTDISGYIVEGES